MIPAPPPVRRSTRTGVAVVEARAVDLRGLVYGHALGGTAAPAHISGAAKLAAYYRNFSDIAFAAEVAALIGADEAFAGIVRDHGLEPDKLTFYAPMFEARYKSITQI